MNVMSLFCGIGAGREALKVSGIPVKKYYRAEIDKFANQIYKNHHPEDINFGDVSKWRDWNVDWGSIDLLIGGSPCQGFSFAGKQLAFDDPRSKLFFVFVDILNHIKILNPNVKFLLENVKMKKDYVDIISTHLGVDPVLINSSLLSAQNRQRYYWFNWLVDQPDDKGIILNDILEKNVDDKYKLSSDAIDYMGRLRNGKERWQYHKNPQFGKSACLTANMYKGVPYGTLRLVCGAIRGRYEFIEGKSKIVQKLEVRKDGKTNTLTTVQKDNILVNLTISKKGKSYALTHAYTGAVAWNSAERKQRSMVSVRPSDDHKNPNVYEGILYRKLTPIECERLQTFPDNYTAGVSNTQRYKALGNSWTVDVISHIFNGLK